MRLVIAGEIEPLNPLPGSHKWTTRLSGPQCIPSQRQQSEETLTDQFNGDETLKAKDKDKRAR